VERQEHKKSKIAVLPLSLGVSMPEFEVNRCTYKALVATKSPVSCTES